MYGIVIIPQIFENYSNMKKNDYIEPLTNVYLMSAFDYFLQSGNAPTIEEDPDAGFPDY